MKIPNFITVRFAKIGFRIMETREPDFVIGKPGSEYLRRWYILPRNPVFNIYLHYFLRGDDDRALHDHPWLNASWLLSGRYIEVTQWRKIYRAAGDVAARLPSTAHRIMLYSGPCLTLFFTGPRVRQWGFHCPQGWRHWRDFVAETDGGNEIGRGCE